MTLKTKMGLLLSVVALLGYFTFLFVSDSGIPSGQANEIFRFALRQKIIEKSSKMSDQTVYNAYVNALNQTVNSVKVGQCNKDGSKASRCLMQWVQYDLSGPYREQSAWAEFAKRGDVWSLVAIRTAN